VRKKESFARRKRDQMQRGLAWRKVESCFMDMEIAWQHQDQARHVVWQRYLQLSQLAEVCYTRTHAHTHTYTHALSLSLSVSQSIITRWRAFSPSSR